MKPVQTENSDLVYVGPNETVRDLHCQRLEYGAIRSVWALTSQERAAIALGANIVLDVFTEPIPPVAVGVTLEQGIGEDAPDIAARLEAFGGA